MKILRGGRQLSFLDRKKWFLTPKSGNPRSDPSGPQNRPRNRKSDPSGPPLTRTPLGGRFSKNRKKRQKKNYSPGAGGSRGVFLKISNPTPPDPWTPGPTPLDHPPDPKIRPPSPGPQKVVEIELQRGPLVEGSKNDPKMTPASPLFVKKREDSPGG